MKELYHKSKNIIGTSSADISSTDETDESCKGKDSPTQQVVSILYKNEITNHDINVLAGYILEEKSQFSAEAILAYILKTNSLQRYTFLCFKQLVKNECIKKDSLKIFYNEAKKKNALDAFVEYVYLLDERFYDEERYQRDQIINSRININIRATNIKNLVSMEKYKDALADIASYYQQTNNAELADKEQAKDVTKHEITCNYKLGLAAFHEKNFKDASQYFENMLNCIKNLSTSKISLPTEVAQELEKLYPGERLVLTKFFYCYGQIYYEDRKYKSAQAYFNLLIEKFQQGQLTNLSQGELIKLYLARALAKSKNEKHNTIDDIIDDVEAAIVRAPLKASLYRMQIWRALDDSKKQLLLDNDQKEYYIDYLEAAAEIQDINAQYKLGLLLYKQKDYFMALKWLSQAANNQHPDAQYLLATLLIQKIGLPEDMPEESALILDKKARQLLKQSAKGNFPAAKNLLSEYYKEIQESCQSEIIIEQQQKSALIQKLIPQTKTYKPPKKKQRTAQENSLDVVLDNKNFSKRVYIKDTTLYGGALAEKKLQQEQSPQKKKNYVTVNLTLVLSDKPIKKDTPHNRIYRTIALSTPMKDIAHLENINNRDGINWKDKFKKRFSVHQRKGLDLLEKYSEQPDTAYSKSYLGFFTQNKLSEKFGEQKSLHSEQALYDWLNQKDTAKQLIEQFKQEYPEDFEQGRKVYAAVLDIYSNRGMCSNCKVGAVSLQNSVIVSNILNDDKKGPTIRLSGFLKNLQDGLKENKLCLRQKPVGLEKAQLIMVTRVRTGAKLNDSKDKEADKNILPTERNIRLFDNMAVLQLMGSREDLLESDEHTVFASGSNAPRLD